MTINKRGGKKHKRGKKIGDAPSSNKNIDLAENGQEYARVLSRLGGARLEVECTDGKKRQAIIPGKFFKKIWMNPGDVILVSIESVGTDDVCSVDKKYNPKEVQILRQKGLITFEETEEEKMQYEFKAAEDNTVKMSNIKEQPLFPEDSDDELDNEYMRSGKNKLETPVIKPVLPIKKVETSESESGSDEDEEDDEDSPNKVYDLNDL